MKVLTRRERWVVGVVPLVFFVVSFLTLGDYGISWDEPAHFFRGQAQIHYFLTGDLDYKKLAERPRQSIYQGPSQPARFFFHDSGHPPINGTLAALFNRVLYQDLGIMGDIESHHLFNVTMGTLAVFVVTVFATEAYGVFAGLVAGLALATYPVFFAESHFNVKDPAEAAFFAATIWCFWKASKGFSWKWLAAAVLFFALGLGTKFNILFLPFILMPWFLVRFGKELVRPLSFVGRLPKKFIVTFLVAPFVVVGIWVGSWVYLWQDPIGNTKSVMKYYRDIGTGGRGQAGYLLPGGFNTFPTVWIVTTTLPVVLVLAFLGVISAVLKFGEKEKTAWLWLAWLVVPILRVSLPDSSIYGGDRQIMEFVPAMALISGLGGEVLRRWLGRILSFVSSGERLAEVMVVLAFMPHVWVLAKLHPNENVYFNFLVGGLAGAKARNIPYWGNSFGNAYYQAIAWLNKNAAGGSRLALIQGTGTNIPRIYLGPNVSYSNGYWSGVDRKGEYLLELTHQGNEMAYPWVWYYVNSVLVPVYEVKVDGVAIARVWKNDAEHSRPEFREEREVPARMRTEGKTMTFEMREETSLSRLILSFRQEGECKPVTSGIVQMSSDGEDWRTVEEKIGDEQVSDYPTLEDGLIRFAFYGRRARFVRLVVISENSCELRGVRATLKGFGS